jgi:hypothetical protein
MGLKVSNAIGTVIRKTFFVITFTPFHSRGAWKTNLDMLG